MSRSLGGHLRGHFSAGCHGFVPRALLVRPEPRQLGVRALTDVALVRPLARVQAHVVPQRGGLTEAAVAEAAHERFVQGVDPHVGAQVAAGVEPAVADDAAHAASSGDRGDGGGRGGGRRAGGRAFTRVGVFCGGRRGRRGVKET